MECRSRLDGGHLPQAAEIGLPAVAFTWHADFTSDHIGWDRLLIDRVDVASGDRIDVAPSRAGPRRNTLAAAPAAQPASAGPAPILAAAAALDFGVVTYA
jgi:hypothetical protein